LATSADAREEISRLEEAFHQRYDVTMTQRVVLESYDDEGRKVLRRVVDIATKRIDGRVHALGIIQEPAQLRGFKMLMIENHHRNNDVFVYLPTSRLVRRISSAQRDDPFAGTDITVEELETRDVKDYELIEEIAIRCGEELCHTIVVTPRYHSRYDRLEFDVATDHVILAVRYFDSRNARTPLKELLAPRRYQQVHSGRVIPSWIEVINHAQGTRTEVRFDRISVNASLPDSVFSRTNLEFGRAIFGVSR